jgi:hypothetical protein
MNSRKIILALIISQLNCVGGELNQPQSVTCGSIASQPLENVRERGMFHLLQL